VIPRFTQCPGSFDGLIRLLMHIVWWAGVSFVAEPTLLSLRLESGMPCASSPMVTDIGLCLASLLITPVFRLRIRIPLFQSPFRLQALDGRRLGINNLCTRLYFLCTSLPPVHIYEFAFSTSSAASYCLKNFFTTECLV
jgi:hypothetical protein